MPKSADQVRGKLLKRAFFQAPPEHVAPRLLGKVLARRTRSGWLGGRIVEVEAYLGPHNTTPDPAAHSHRGPTPRNLALFGPPGHAYVYFIYGRYYCMNFSCEEEGLGGGILLRALEPLAGIEQMAAAVAACRQTRRHATLPAAPAVCARLSASPAQPTTVSICSIRLHLFRSATTDSA